MAGEVWDDPMLFEDRAAFRAWLEAHHDTADELWVGFFKKATGKGGLQYKEAVDECLCWGWIDGIRKRVDDEVYTNRVTPRKAKSKWSKVNVDRYAELDGEGRIAPPGRAAFARFDASEHAPYSFETRPKAFPPDLKDRFQEHADAWAFFQEQPAGYRRSSVHWVVSARRESTRIRRLEQLIAASTEGERLPQIAGKPRRKR